MEEELEKLEERYKFLVPLYPLNYTGITKYFNYELRFNGVVSRNNLPQIKDRAYVINLDHQKSKGTHRVSLFIDRNTAVYFDTFEVLHKISYKSITYNIFRIQDKYCILCGLCVAWLHIIYALRKNKDYTS